MSVPIFYQVTAELRCVFQVLKGLRDSYFLWVDLMLDNITSMEMIVPFFLTHGDDNLTPRKVQILKLARQEPMCDPYV